MAELLTSSQLISSDDPAPVEIVNPQSESDVLLVCEHAGQATPAALGTLGLHAQDFNSHIGWDIGAEAVARLMAEALDAPLILQRYSRLVIDCNRPPGSEGSIPTQSAGVRVPGNEALTPSEKNARVREVFDPYDTAVASMLASRQFRSVFSIHSFTPEFPGETRPWDLGLLNRSDHDTALGLIRHITIAQNDLSLTLNQPYQIEDGTDWLIPRHAEANGLCHALIEIRNTHIRDARGQQRWGTLLANAIRAEMETSP